MGDSVDVALAYLGVVGAVVGGTPSVCGTEGANNLLVFEGVAELED